MARYHCRCRKCEARRVFLAKKHGEAQAAGKARVTAGAINGKPLPRALAVKLEQTIAETVDCLPVAAVTRIEELRTAGGGSIPKDATVSVPAWLLANLLDDHAAIIAERQKQEQRARERAAKAAQMDIEEA